MAAEAPGRSRVEILQGTLDMLILQTLRSSPQHGYGLSQLIRTKSGERLRVDTGSLYPALHRLERKKWVGAEWKLSENKQRTKIYHLTPAGRRQLSAERSKWAELSKAIGRILAPPAESAS